MDLLDTLAELTVVGSYGRAGYARRSRTFDPADLDVDLAGKVVVVTGATSGIGLAAAVRLAELRARVVLVGRNAEKLDAALARVRATGTAQEPVAERCDLSDLAEVEALSRRLLERFPAIHVLAHNAGLLPLSRELTPQGHERAFATHVLAPFLLTSRLLPALGAAGGSRVVWVTSGGMYTQKLDLRRCRALDGKYDGVRAYAQQKRAQVLLNGELARRLAGHGITSNAMHPGWSDTPGVERSLPAFKRLMDAVLRTPEEGADTLVWLCASARAGAFNGKLFLDRVERRTEVLPGTHHGDADVAALWKLCVEQTGVDIA